MNRIEFTDEQKQHIVKKYEEGTPMRKIGEEFGVSKHTIRRILVEQGIEIRDNSHAHIGYLIDESYFDQIDTPNKAYVLGLLYADGTVGKNLNSVKLTLQDRDIKILQDIAKDMKTDRPLYKDELSKKNPNWMDAYTFTFCNEHMHDKLIDLGVVPNKSLILQFPTKIPEQFMRDFIRGYVDGDGHVEWGRNKVASVTQSVFFCTGLQEYLKKHLQIKTVMYKLRSHHENTRLLNVRNKTDVYKLLELLYEGSELHIDRKYAVYLKAKEEMTKKTLSD